MPTNRNSHRYAIGEVADFAVDTPILTNHYGSFLRSNGAWVAKEKLNERAKSFIRLNNYASGIRLSNLQESYPFNIPNGLITLGRPCSANGVSLFMYAQSSEILGCDSDGFFRASLGISARNGNVFGHCTYGLVSDDANFYAYYLSSNNDYRVKTSTNGRTWVDQSLTGMSTPASSGTIGSFWNNGNQIDNNTGLLANQTCSNHGPFIAAWCGARMLLLTVDGGGFIRFYTSSNRLTFTNISASTVGNAYVASESANSYFYRNGNFCFLGYMGGWFYTNDGGVNWSTCSGISGQQAGTRFIVNKSNPARLLSISSGTSILVSLNSGASWVSRATPETLLGANYLSVAYVGDTILLGILNAQGNAMSFYKSQDNGASWDFVVLPKGITGGFTINYDGNRWLLVSTSQAILLTSNDAITFLVRLLPMAVNQPASNSIALDNLTTVISDNTSQLLFTKDGGVTWDVFSTTSKNGTSYQLRGSLNVVDVAGSQYLLGGCPTSYGAGSNYSGCVLKTDSLRSRGEFFNFPTVTPGRGGLFSYVRYA